MQVCFSVLEYLVIRPLRTGYSEQFIFSLFILQPENSGADGVLHLAIPHLTIL